jgi:L-ascorbate metabolism protein UlaG (beta-lactamase superfamily)
MSAKITFLGQSTFLGESDKGKKFYIDPWLEGNPRCPEQYKKPESVDFMVLTHGHADHISDVIKVFNTNNCNVAGPYELVNLLSEEGNFGDKAVPMGKGGTVHFDSLEVTLTHAMHSSSYNGQYSGEPCGIIMKFENGKTLYHAGDTNVFGDMKLISELYSPDLCLLPIGSRFTMNEKEAALATELLSAKRVVPIHFGTFPLLTGTSEQYKKEVQKRKLSTEINVLEPGDTIEI